MHIYSCSVNILGLFVGRPSPAQIPVTGEEARDSEEESEYMIPSSRPLLPPITAPPVGEIQPGLRPPQHQPLSALLTQTQASTLNSRYSDHSVTLAELEDGPQMYEAMYNIQARSQQGRDSGILIHQSIWKKYTHALC